MLSALIVLTVVCALLCFLCVCIVKTGQMCINEEVEKRQRAETLLDTFIKHCNTCEAVNADIAATRRAMIEAVIREIQESDSA
jgi:hypothetical protein